MSTEAPPASPTRTCRHCGETFGPSPTERVSSFTKRDRKFCSQVCNGAAKTARTERALGPARTCARDGCDAVLERRTTEKVYAFRRRRFCSYGCAHPKKPARPRAPRTARSTAPERASTARPTPVLSVFGDVAPAQPWRPAGFSATPTIDVDGVGA